MRPDIKIEYDGDCPKLCRGNLTVTIVWEFPPRCLSSGGGIYDDWTRVRVERGEWEITEWPDGFPEELKQAVVDEVNEVVPWGCCGGCI